jgi:CRP-like cAMP-binding protein
LSHSEILASLRDAPLFKGLKDPILKDLAQHCEIWKLEVDEQVRINPKSVPILLITKGCITATSTTGFGRFEKIVLALLMPTQLVCEFEYFGNALPKTAGLRAVDETEIVAIPSAILTELIRSNPDVMRNLAMMLVTKINICNFHLEAVSQTQGDKKIATMLSGFVRLAEWVPPAYQDAYKKSPMPITIVWDVELFVRFLSSNYRTVVRGLGDLISENLIGIKWLDDALTPRSDIGPDDLAELGKKNSKLDARTRFRVTIQNPGKLERYCGD